MKQANIAIVQEPPLLDCGWDLTGNIIWANEHFLKKLLTLFITSIRALMMQLTMKILMNQNLDGKAQVTIVTLNKGFRKFVWLKSEAFLNLIKQFQRLNDYDTVILFFFRQALLRHQYPIEFFLTPEESSVVCFYLGHFSTFLQQNKSKHFKCSPF